MRLLADSGYVDTSPLHSGGSVDDHILTAFGPIFWISMVVWVVVSGLIIFAAVRYRRRSDDEEPRQLHGNNRLELAWTALPFAVLMGLFALTTVQMQYIRTTPAGAMPVCVVAARYSWTYHYNYSGSCTPKNTTPVTVYQFAVATDSIYPVYNVAPFVIPANTPVSIDITSSDVIHSYYVPTLAGQMNAVPGQVNHFWLDARPGKYYGQCTELCGEGHAQMLIEVDAVSQAQYNAWYAQNKASQ